MIDVGLMLELGSLRFEAVWVDGGWGKEILGVVLIAGGGGDVGCI